MPIYEYDCDVCGEDFELLILRDDQPVCPACESTEVTRRLSLPRPKTTKTHGKAMRAAKKRDKRMNAEQTRARIEYEEAHDD